MRRPDQYEIIIHDLATIRRETLSHKRIFRCFGMHKDRIHVPCAPKTQRLAGADDQKLNFQSDLCLDHRQKHIRQSRIMKARRHRQPHGFSKRHTPKSQPHQDRKPYHSMISPFKNACASGVSGVTKNLPAAPRSCTFPPSRNTTSDAMRRAWPKSCVVMMICVPLK